MSFHIVIPARFDSTRLPGKVLLDIAGQPMMQHVYNKAILSGADSVTIATDSNQVSDIAKGFGANVVMTSCSHSSGTLRIGEAVSKIGLLPTDIVIGLQADEPFIPHTIIGDLAKDLSSNAQHTIASICTQLTSADDLLNPNIVKVVLDKNCNAIYFSRAAIPSKLGGATLSRLHYKHIGIYGYRVNFLQDYIAWGPCALEQAESLEQLRILWHGERIHMNICNAIPGGIDTLQQYEAIRCINTES